MSLILKSIYRFDEYELDRSRRVLLRGGEDVPLMPKAFDVLLCLVEHAGQVVTKEQLLQTVWPGAFVEEDNLVQHVSALRKAFAGQKGYIVTLPGRGYQFTPHVEEVATSPRAAADSRSPEPASAPMGQTVVQRVRERTRFVVEEPLPPRPWWRSPWIAWGVTAAVLLSIAGYFSWKRFGPQPHLRRVVLADFLNLTGDPQMDRTLKSALRVGLEQSPYLQLMSGSLEHETLTNMQKAPDTPLLGQTALDVCARGNYQALLRGTVAHPQGNEYQLKLEVANCRSGKTLAAFQATAPDKDTILDALDGLTRKARVKLGEPNDSLDRFNVPLSDATTYSFEALSAYNEGVALGNAGKLKECIQAFQHAVDIDPKFAVAQADLGTAYYNQSAWATAAAYSKKAFDLSGNVSEGEKLFIRYNYYLMTLKDLPATIKILDEWTKIYPEDETGWEAMGNVQTQIGNFNAAIAASEYALKHFPHGPAENYNILALAYKRANRFADAKRIVAQAQAQGMDNPFLHQVLYWMATAERDPGALKREAEWAKGKPEAGTILGAEAIEAADEGRVTDFEAGMEVAMRVQAREVNAEFADATLNDEASIEAQLGRTDKAAEVLRRIKDREGAYYAISAIRAGDMAAGEAYLRKKEENPQDTMEHFLLRPELAALLALHRHDPAAAIAALEPARPFELVRCEIIEIRASAYAAAGLPESAAQEYSKLIANPALEEPMLPRTVLAHLGLARALATEQKLNDSRSEYEKFFSLWKDADPNLAILIEARREYAKLNRTPDSGSPSPVP